MSDLINREDAIDAWDKLSKRGRTEFDQVLMSLPSVEAVQVVRCKDCKRYETLNYTDDYTGDVSHKYVCRLCKRQMLPTDYCSYGKRREDGEV